MSNQLTVIVTIEIDGVEVKDTLLKKYILDARSKMCDKFNNGWIDKYNAVMEELGLDNADVYPAYQEAYTLISNEYWTKLLHESGRYTDLRIVDEVFIPISDYYECWITLERI